jgi:hypothetical protein
MQIDKTQQTFVVDERSLVFGKVQCADCCALSTAEEIVISHYRCPHCFVLICFICGCTMNRACLRGCAWLRPGVCTTHKGELEEAVERVFGLSRGNA